MNNQSLDYRSNTAKDTERYYDKKRPLLYSQQRSQNRKEIENPFYLFTT